MADKSWYLYIISCGDSSLYTGITLVVERRLQEHRTGRGSRYLRSRLPLKLVYQVETPGKSEALQLEYKVKQLTRAQKLGLITAQPKLKKLYKIIEDD